MRPLLAALLLLSTTTFAEGTELDAVRQALTALEAHEPVQGALSVTRWERTGGDKPQEGSAGATFTISATRGGVSVSASQALVSARRKEKEEGPPDVKRSIVERTDLAWVSRWLNQAAPLLAELESAELLEDKETTLADVPAHALKLKFEPKQESEGGAEAKTERTLTLWVDAQHLPLASEGAASTAGGFLVVKFDNRQTAARKYARVGDRLVLLEETTTDSTSTMGRTFQSKQTGKLELK